jgi:hypothetical protein
LATAGSLFRVQSDGKVGIGTTSPTAKLEVYSTNVNEGIDLVGNISSANQNSDSLRLRFQGYAQTNGPFIQAVNTVAYGMKRLGFFVNRTANDYTTLPTESVSILNNGNVGIGTTTPGHKLTVKSSGTDTYPIMVEKNGNTNSIFAVQEDASGHGNIRVNNSTATKVLINSSGDSYFTGGEVGIGTAAPNVRFHVETSVADVLSKFINTDGTNGHGLLIKAGGSASGKYIATFRDAANNTRMHLLADGNVGIGTATPARPLHVEGSVSDNLIRVQNTNSSSYSSIEYYNSAGSLKGVMGIGNPSAPDPWKDNAYIYSAASTDILFAAGTTEKMRIKSDGKVGIGTTAPRSLLELGSSGLHIDDNYGIANFFGGMYYNGSSMVRTATGTRAPAGMYVNTGGHIQFITAPETSGTTATESIKFHIDNNGKVGIGTTTPGSYWASADDLVIVTTGNTGMTLVAGTTSSSSAIAFADGTGSSSYRGRIEYNHSTDKLMLGAGGATPFAIKGDGNTSLPDNSKALFGTGDDLQIYHDGSHSYIDDAGTGGLYLRSNDFRVYNAAGTERMIQADDDGAVVLYHNALTKLATTATGVDITGQLSATTKSFLIDHPTKPGKKLRHGSLEGPENGVYIRGRGDNNIITLPEYWTELVDKDSITVQLTPIGKHQHIYVEKIENNTVYIQSDETRKMAQNFKFIDYYYLILAERKDVDKLVIEE